MGAAPFTERITLRDGDFLIAADGGRDAILQRGMKPDLTVGDFDSGEAPGENEEPFLRFPVAKDETDTALAVREGIKRGYAYFMLYGCVGSLDHTLANIQLLHGMAKAGLHGYLVGGGWVSTVLTHGTMRFAPTGRVSVFSLADVSKGVCIRGLEYPLKDACLTSDTPLGVSNRGRGEAAEIGLNEGALFVTWESASEEM